MENEKFNPYEDVITPCALKSEKGKHTPGPWGLEWIFNGGCNIRPEDGHGRLATVWVRRSKVNNLEEVGANARLIASAPEYHEHAYNLAVLVLQSEAYRDYEIRSAVDNVLAIWRKVE